MPPLSFPSGHANFDVRSRVVIKCPPSCQF